MATAPPGFPQDNPACPPSMVIVDDVAFEVKLRAPTNATGYSFAFKFYSFEFPEAFKATPEVIMLVSVYHNLGGLEQALYIVHPQENAIDVVLLDWWNEGDFDFGYQWITKVGRGPGGRLFGTGFRINPFVMKETGEFIEWIQPPSDSLGSQRIPS